MGPVPPTSHGLHPWFAGSRFVEACLEPFCGSLMTHASKRVLVVMCIALLTAVGLSGCSSGNKSPATASATRTRTVGQGAHVAQPGGTVGAVPNPTSNLPAAADLANGKVLVQAQCAACHALADAGITGANPPYAPALDRIGVGHDRSWLAAELVDACAHPIASTAHKCAQAHNAAAALTQQQRDQVVTYLLSLR
jgi:mono/diheme cytochrome c family protein